mmetsp:Transcript_10249/g.19370  ORF Transcript_10249/g.19370 Transcript_10249/m.19370 type:complete len:297 (+) Transcript_10249:116-1006(+)
MWLNSTRWSAALSSAGHELTLPSRGVSGSAALSWFNPNPFLIRNRLMSMTSSRPSKISPSAILSPMMDPVTRRTAEVSLLKLSAADPFLIGARSAYISTRSACSSTGQARQLLSNSRFNQRGFAGGSTETSSTRKAPSTTSGQSCSSSPSATNGSGPTTEVGLKAAAGGAAGSQSTGLIGKFKDMWNRYGWVFVGTYFGVWFGTLSSFYLMVENHMMKVDNFDDDAMPNPFNPVEMARFVTTWLKQHIGLDVGFDKIDPKASSAVVAYICTKITEPLRFLVAAILTPRVARLLGRA